MFSFTKKAILKKSVALNDLEATPRLSFCITHKNRFESLKMTLLKNLNDNLTERKHIEFVLMDFDENEEVRHWIWDHFEEFLSDGYLKYFHCDQLDQWHASIAKNTSHKMAQGIVLVNLDCDNYTGVRGGRFVYDQFIESTQEIVLWQFSKVKQDGSFGRIALTKELFYALGGYDESFLPMGYQDNDLMERARAMGAMLVRKTDSTYNQAIPNEKFTPPNMTYKQMKMTNKAASQRKINKGILTANGGQLGLSQISTLDSCGELVPYDKKEVIV